MKLMNREKKRMKLKAIRDLLMMIVTVLEDFVRRVCYDNNVGAEAVAQQYDELRSYYTDHLDKIKEVHGGAIAQQLKIFE